MRFANLAIDPVAIATNAISSLQWIVSWKVDPMKSAVVSICKMEAGSGAYNLSQTP
jgi:metal-dependent amidase/aminoacylase/carboxypeptidase family protein